MTTKLHAIKQEPMSDLLRLSSSLEIIETNLARLTLLVSQVGFSTQEEEILFFKNVKPKFVGWKIFMVEQFNIISNIPTDTDEAIKNYYIREIGFLTRYFEQNQFLYQYFIVDKSTLDAEYFLRKNRQKFFSATNLAEFETQGDYSFAKFWAYEKLREFLLARIKLIYSQPDSSIFQMLSKNSELRWTDDKIKLVELAYGIYFMGSLNFGKADISQVVEVLERTLNVDLGVAYRKFIDISRRKNKGYTVYLDGMRSAINDHIARKMKYR